MENSSKLTGRDLEQMLERVNVDDAFAKNLGIRVVELSSGCAKALMDITDDHINLFQMAHGGVIFSVADHACEAAGNSFGKPAVAIQNNIHFLSAGAPGIVWKPRLESFIGREGLASSRPWYGTNI
jgi:acyl-coenzyme A thioesterase PaaI-like protein